MQYAACMYLCLLAIAEGLCYVRIECTCDIITTWLESCGGCCNSARAVQRSVGMFSKGLLASRHVRVCSLDILQ